MLLIIEKVDFADLVIRQQVGIYDVVFGLALAVLSVLWGWKKFRIKK